MKKLKILSIILLFALFIALPFYNNVQAVSGYIMFDARTVDEEEEVINSVQGTILKPSADVSIFAGGDATISDVISSDENIVKVDSTGKLIILSTGKCSLSLDAEKYGDTDPLNLIILSDQTFAKAKEDQNMLWNDLKIVGDQARWTTDYGDEHAPKGEMKVGTTAKIVKSDGTSLSNVTYRVTGDPSREPYLSVNENGEVTANSEGYWCAVGVTLVRDEYTVAGSVEINGVTEFTIPGNDGENQGGNQGQVPEQNGNQNEGKPEGNAPQSSGTQSGNRTLDNEPKTGIDTKTSVFVSGLALVSLAVAIITRKI